MAGVGGADAGNHRSASAHRLHTIPNHPQVLLVGERHGLAGGSAHDDSVGAVFEQMLHEACRGLLVEASLLVEGVPWGQALAEPTAISADYLLHVE